MTGQEKSKLEIAEERRQNLDLPEAPPSEGVQKNDFNSLDTRTTAVGSGATSAGTSDSGLRGPATADSAVRVDGEDNKTNVAGTGVGRVGGGLPSDALAGKARDSAKATETRGEDYGYPEKSDPAHK